VQAIAAINQAVEKQGKPEAQYTMGAQVWLEGKNLRLPYQLTKLVPKRYGPFKIIKEVSPVAYQLDLPVMWEIHDIQYSTHLFYHPITKQHNMDQTLADHHQTLSKGKWNMRWRPSGITGTSGAVTPCNTLSNGKDTPRVITPGSQLITSMHPIC
jgi:hypothetical protein